MTYGLKALVFSVSFLLPVLSSAAALTNGDFSTGDFSGWTTDTDGASGTAPDFQIQSSGSDYFARIEADYWSTPGDTTSTPQDAVQFANTLLQGLDLSAASGQQITLSFDWTYDGQAAQDENFMVALGDGSGNYFAADGSNGFLINPSSYGSGHFSVVLDSSFANASGWSLELQLNAAFDGNGSYVQIDNVTLVSALAPPVVTPPATATPIPLSFAHWLSIIALLVAGSVILKRKENEVSHSCCLKA